MRSAPATLQELLSRACAFPATGLRFVDGAERESFLAWPEVARRAAAVGGGLAALGVEPGERVALVYPNRHGLLRGLLRHPRGRRGAGAALPPVRLARLAEYQERTAAMLAAAGAVAVLVDGRIGALAGAAIERARPRLGGFETKAWLDEYSDKGKNT